MPPKRDKDVKSVFETAPEVPVTVTRKKLECPDCGLTVDLTKGMFDHHEDTLVPFFHCHGKKKDGNDCQHKARFVKGEWWPNGRKPKPKS